MELTRNSTCGGNLPAAVRPAVRGAFMLICRDAKTTDRLHPFRDVPSALRGLFPEGAPPACEETVCGEIADRTDPRAEPLPAGRALRALGRIPLPEKRPQ